MTVQKLDEEAIFHAARKIEAPDARGNYLKQVCGDNAAIRSRVQALLQVHDADKSFLVPPAPEMLATLSERLTERLGTVIGPYKLMEQIGEGGMGLVFVAEQQQPVRRKVALKVIKPGMDTREVIARLEAERQALALMDHPNIAKMLDAGSTGIRNQESGIRQRQDGTSGLMPDSRSLILDEGRPYFVMELVRGVPITQFCDDNRLTTRERLELVIPVCQAVQHAHQKGIIHRDIKPSNVLVTLHDGRPLPKVIDFGVAKAIGQHLTEKTIYTRFAQMIGTPLYMSPEQAEMSSLDVDTRTDIYALGVLLYELLTGRTPFDEERLRTASFDEVRRIIREEEPLKPSTRISTLGQAATSVSAQRKSDPMRLRKLFRGELDWIVMKCLEKDRDRRYETASGLARDIERYLRDEPVQACPPSAGYRLRKFVRRNRGPVLAASFVLLALVAGIIGTTVGLVQAKWAEAKARSAETDARYEAAQKEIARAGEEAEKNHAVQAEQETKAQAAITQAVNEFFHKDLLGQADIANQPLMIGGLSGGRNRNVTVRELLDRAAKEIEGKFEGQELTEAAIRQTIGNAYRGLGKYPEAQKHLERSVQLVMDKLGADHPITLAGKQSLAVLYFDQAKYHRAETLLKEVFDSHTAQLGADHRDTLNSRRNLAVLCYTQGKYEQAGTEFKQVLDVQLAKWGADHPETLRSKTELATVYHADGKWEQAKMLFQEAIDAQSAKLGPDHPAILHSKYNLAMLHTDQMHYDRAETLLQNVIDIQIAKLGADHPDTLSSKHGLTRLYVAQGKYEQAETLLKAVIDAQTGQLGADHPITLTSKHTLFELYLTQGKYDRGEMLLKEVIDARTTQLRADRPVTLQSKGDLAFLYSKQGKYDKAETLLKEVIDAQTAQLRADHPDTLGSKTNLASLYQAQGKYDQAKTLYKEVIDAQTTQLQAGHPAILRSKNNLATLYQDQGTYDRAEMLHKEVIEAQTIQLRADHPDTLISKNNLATVYKAQEKYDQAETLFKQVIDALTAQLGADHPTTLSSRDNLASVYGAKGQYDRAERLCKEVLDARSARLGADHPDTLTSQHNLAVLYQVQRKYDQAEMLYKQVIDARTAKLGASHPSTLNSKSNLAELYFAQGKYDQTEALLKEVIDGRTAKLRADHPHVLNNKRGLAVVYSRMGKPGQSVPLAEEVLRARRKTLGDDHRTTVLTAYELARIYRDAGRLADAATVIDEWLRRGWGQNGLDHPDSQFAVQTVLSIYERAGTPTKAEPILRELAGFWKKKAGADSPQYAAQLAQLSLTLLQQQKGPEAEVVLRECLPIRQMKEPDAWTTFSTQSLLGEALLLQKKYADAEALLAQGYEGIKQREAKIPPQGKVRLTEALERLVQLYDAWGKKDEAARWCKELEAHKKKVSGVTP